MNRKLQPDSNVLRIHIHHVMKGSLHDGTVMVDRDGYRLVGFLLVVVSHQMSD